MIALIKRCIHCGTEYTYYASGVSDEYNNKHYCPICYEAMMKALKQIPIKYEARYKEIDGYLKKTVTYDILERIKNKFVDDINNSPFKTYAMKAVLRHIIMGENGELHYANENIYEEEYHYQRKQFKVSWDKNNPNVKKIEVLWEYDLIENKFTNNIWKLDTDESTFIPLTTSPKLKIDKENWFTPCVANKEITGDILANELTKIRYGEKNK